MAKYKSRKRVKKKTKSRKLKGGYTPPKMDLKFTSEQQATDNAITQQQHRNDYNAANNKMIGGSQDIIVPSPPGVSAAGQNNINKLVLANATAESLGKYDKVGGMKSKRNKKVKKSNKRRKRKTARKSRKKRVKKRRKTKRR